MYYTGIGSRKTPQHVLEDMFNHAIYLAERGYTLRSGGANGADTAFEKGCDYAQGDKQIFLPWNGFNNLSTADEGYYVLDDKFYGEAEEIAEKHHPAWDRCSQGARRMHTRNVAQILGPELSEPCELVICWTPNGSGSGGTGQAIRIAKSLGIPVLDLGAN